MEETPEEAATGPTPPVKETPFLFKLNDALAPVRRVVIYAVHSERDVRYLEGTLSRWFEQALALTLPDAVRDALESMHGLLVGIDGVEQEERRGRLVAMGQQLERLEQTLGLPLPPRPLHKPKKPKFSLQEETMEAAVDSASSGEQSRVETRQDERQSREDAANDDAITEDDFLVEESQDARVEPSPEPAEEDLDKPIKLPKKHKSREEISKPWALWDRTPRAVLADLGISDELGSALKAAGVETTTDLLLLNPVSQVRVKPIRGAGRSLPAGEAAVSGRVVWRKSVLQPDGTQVHEVCLRGAKRQTARWETIPAWYAWEQLAPGAKAVLVGQHTPVAIENTATDASTVEDESVDDEDASLDADLAVEGAEESFQNGLLIDAEVVKDDGKNAVRLARYGLDGIADRDVRALLCAMFSGSQKLHDWLPGNIVKRNKLLSLHDAIGSIHGVTPYQSGGKARLAFDEALLGQLGLTLNRYQGNKERGIPHQILHGYTCQAARFWDHDLGDAQQVVLEDIKRDLRRSTPMRRVITGEVGSGKAIVSLAAISVVAEGKSQVLFLAQNRLYAESSFVFIEPLLRELGLVGRVLKGPPSEAVRDALGRGEIHVVFATKEDVADPIEFRRLGLVVVEEASEWGGVTEYLEKLKAPKPDILINSVRPLPTAAFFGSYSTFDISVIADTERQPVEGVIASSDQRMEAYAQAAKVLKDKAQVTVVFPISPTTGQDLFEPREALQLVKALETEALRGACQALSWRDVT